MRTCKAYTHIFLISQKAFHCSHTFINQKNDYLDERHYFEGLLFGCSGPFKFPLGVLIFQADM